MIASRPGVGVGAALAAAGILAVAAFANAPAAAADKQPAGATLVVNPRLARPIPSPGTLADSRDTWPDDHPVYKETCRTDAVVDEIRFMNRVVDFDDYLVNQAQAYISGAIMRHDAPTAKRAMEAKATLINLHRDIAAADELSGLLQKLPSCDAPPPATATATKPATTPAPTTPPPAASSPAPPVAGIPVKTAAAAPPAAPEVPAEATPATSHETTPEAAAPASAAPAAPPPGDGPPRMVIRFDDRLAALTPTGIRTLDRALDAAFSGKKVLLAIEGCDADADYSNGSICERRTRTLMRLLADNGVRNPKSLLANPH